MFFRQNKKLTITAKTLRRNMTKEENHLWYDFLKKYPVHIYKQRLIGNYIADFYCSDARLIIELDGSQHYEQNTIKHDINRTKYFNSLGIKVIRFTNLDIHDRFDGVCYMIDQEVTDRLPKPLSQLR